MTDIVETGEEVSVTPTPAEVSTPVVDEEALRAQIEADLRSEYDKKAKGLEAAAAAERRKRQELEATPKEMPDLDELVNKKFQERDALAEQERENERLQGMHKTLQERLNQSKELYGDTDPLEVARSVGDVLASGVNHNRDVQLYLMESEKSAQLFKYLADNPEELSKLSNASPLEQGRKLTAIESSLSSVTLTNAPDPITPLTGGSGGVDDIYELEGDSFEAELRKRNGGSVFPA